jgi:hypothetical protein
VLCNYKVCAHNLRSLLVKTTQRRQEIPNAIFITLYTFSRLYCLGFIFKWKNRKNTIHTGMSIIFARSRNSLEEKTGNLLIFGVTPTWHALGRSSRTDLLFYIVKVRLFEEDSRMRWSKSLGQLYLYKWKVLKPYIILLIEL